jgi:hypothetical protein
MEMVVESMKMAPGAIPHPSRVPEQRLLSPKIHLRRRWRCGTLSRKTPIGLGFSRWRLSIGGGAMSEGTRGAHQVVARPGVDPRHQVVWRLLALLRLCFGLRLMPGKIGTSGFILSNSENISCVTFLKHKNSR